MSREKQTYNPCDDCLYSYSKNNQEHGMCKICEFTYFKDRKQGEPNSCDHEKGLILTIDGVGGYFPKEFIVEAIKTHMRQRVGEWIAEGDMFKEYVCSVCGYSVDSPYQRTPYCPNCGAKMKGGEE